MRQMRLHRALVGIALLLVSCGSVSGQASDAGNGGGGRGGGGGGGGAGSPTGGADGAGASCPSVPACGGDIVGTWKVSASCLDATKDLSSVCAGASADIAYTFDGTVTYKSDQTYSSALTATATVHEHYPNGCMPFGLTCVQLGAVAADAATTVSASCSIDGSGTCNCTSVTTPTVTNTPGTYSISGNTLTTVQGSTTSATTYCVRGGVLYELPAASDGGLTSMGDIVLTRQ